MSHSPPNSPSLIDIQHPDNHWREAFPYIPELGAPTIDAHSGSA